MREYLFRGKRKDNGEWVKGYLYVTQKGQYEISRYSESYDCERFTAVVIPETVGQYTGLTDKNGNKIFEWDIVHAVYSDGYIGVPDTDYGNLIVGFDDTYYGGARYSMKIVGDTGYRIFSAGLRNGVTVIGNIHDDPELLKVGDDK